MTPDKKLGLTVVLSLMSLFVGCNALVAPLVYFAEAMHGRVIDSHTLQPIEGVVVVAEWIPVFLIHMDGGHAKPIKVLETVTDSQGTYAFPSWGPRLRSPLWSLTYMDPQIIIFKAGYKARVEVNNRHRNNWVRASDWNGVELEVELFQGTPAERLKELDRVLDAGWDRTLPKALAQELLKEQPSLGSVDKPFFDNVERLREGR